MLYVSRDRTNEVSKKNITLLRLITGLFTAKKIYKTYSEKPNKIQELIFKTRLGDKKSTLYLLDILPLRGKSMNHKYVYVDISYIIKTQTFRKIGPTQTFIYSPKSYLC